MDELEPRAWLEIEPGERFIRYGDIARRLAEALHPTHLEDESWNRAFARAQFNTELDKSVDAGALVPRNALTGGPHEFAHGAALEDAVINLRDLQAFAQERDIGVRVRGKQPPPGLDAPSTVVAPVRPRGESAAPANATACEWQELARIEAGHIRAAAVANGWFPNLKKLGDEVAEVFRKKNIFGPNGHAMSGAHITRNALQGHGITKPVDKLRSTMRQQGK